MRRRLEKGRPGRERGLRGEKSSWSLVFSCDEGRAVSREEGAGAVRAE